MITYTHWTTPSSVTIIINIINHNIKNSTMLTIKKVYDCSVLFVSDFQEPNTVFQ